jgi:DNA-binding CsgD family transcriptional regulator
MAVAREGPRSLLEREDSLAALTSVWAAVVEHGIGRLAVVSGEAGAGKTSLLQVFCRSLEESARVLWGGCDPLFTPRPLGPLFTIAEDAGGELAELLAVDARPHELVAAITRDVRSHGPTVLVLEDVQWADEATLDVLRLLVRRADRLPALLVVSARDDELVGRRPLGVLLGEFAAGRTLKRIKLDRLSREAVRALAAHHEVDVDELYAKTAGNPFFVVEVIATGDDGVPDTVRDAVLARAARLEPAGRRLLEAIALLPPRADMRLLEAVADDALDAVDSCASSGMVVESGGGLAFRHELARLAVEEAIEPGRRIALHRGILRRLAASPLAESDPARLAHHAEAASEADAVLRYAPSAASRAAAVGAYREAAAQYARALRFGDRLGAAERADMLVHQSQACYLTDEYDEGIAALERAREYRAAIGDVVGEAAALRRLATFHWCPGRIAESDRCAREAVSLLETVPASRELALAYSNLAMICDASGRMTEAHRWAGRSIAISELLGEADVTAAGRALTAAIHGDFAVLEADLEQARRDGDEHDVAQIMHMLLDCAVEQRAHVVADRHVEPANAYFSERGFELIRLYSLSSTARLRLDQGRWVDAADAADAVVRIPRTSTMPRIRALVVLALVRARRGDPDVASLLDEAWALAAPTGEPPRIAPVAAARAEAALLSGNARTVGPATDEAFELARGREQRWWTGELAVWRSRAGLDVPELGDLPERYALELAGDHAGAARAWRAATCPYDAALALAGSDDPAQLREALEELTQLGARPAAALAARRLREQGVRGLPRGPYSRARENAAGLTARELEIVGLIANGLRNAEIAEQLVVSHRTVEHHVSAILRKLDARTRSEAVVAAMRLGLVQAAGQTVA